MDEQSKALLKILPAIERAAAHVALEWPNIVDAEDLVQEISVRLLRDSYATTVQNMDPRARRRSLYKIGTQIASSMRVDYDRFSGNYRYSTGEVRDRLEKGALAVVGFDRVPTPPASYDGVADPVVEMSIEDVDIRNAFTRISEDHQAALVERFLYGVISPDWKKVTRAIDALTSELNRSFRRGWEQHNGPGSRRVVSSERARKLTRRLESGDE
ncbi:MAG: hypothetical protein IRZ03_08355 [Acidobacterium ailaaui]|nr:hypothetical protein [Pseudacidobacterium ailaaui]